jgi:O2-independent ubiquinone biosynthesis protein UbiV
VLQWFDRVYHRGVRVEEARIALDALSLPGGLVNGFAHHQPGLHQVFA